MPQRRPGLAASLLLLEGGYLEAIERLASGFGCVASSARRREEWLEKVSAVRVWLRRFFC